jgi:hypothetical protein
MKSMGSLRRKHPASTGGSLLRIADEASRTEGCIGRVFDSASQFIVRERPGVMPSARTASIGRGEQAQALRLPANQAVSEGLNH